MKRHLTELSKPLCGNAL